MINHPHKNSFFANGFTLLEILVALFIFTILSMLLMSALRTVINADNGTEIRAGKLQALQLATLLISRDVEQTLDRSVVSAAGVKEPAFLGTPRAFTFTHMGFANPQSLSKRSTLQRTQYSFGGKSLQRKNWEVLDLAPGSKSHTRLLVKVDEAHFQYLDNSGHWQNQWPPEETNDQSLPRAVKVFLTIPHWGKLSQIYVIPAYALPNEQKSK